MGMLMDCELIVGSEEIQKIVVFEGAYEKIFSIIREEGNSDGGVVVQDCLELLNNLIHTNASNQVLRVEIEAPMQSLRAPEPLMHRMVKYLALASSMKSKDGKSDTSGNSYVQAIILKLLVTWLADCPNGLPQCSALLPRCSTPPLLIFLS
ncbi:unnamed protein product [Trifolium pratense]|uniref:Uncharacterized protein n=1 Tax=Trifolium pratense TaxID=57577 RepID=A0ACB0LAV7_TRIPR|nr:unnamed protein product [Trifolium pratense]